MLMSPPQSGEDLLAWQTYFHGMRDGVYLEMGALDGATAACWPEVTMHPPCRLHYALADM